jgi:3-methyladenine DNA glycosylase AlkC
MELTPAQAFEVERHSRLLDEISDAKTLRNMAKLLLQSWYAQKAATAWAIRQGMRR